MTFNPKKHISYFAKTNFRTDGKVFGIKQFDRAFHILVLGKTGSGKSNLLRTLIYQDIIQSRGLCIFDLHDDLISDIRKYLPYRRLKDIVYLDIPNPLCILNNTNFNIINVSVKDKPVYILNYS